MVPENLETRLSEPDAHQAATADTTSGADTAGPSVIEPVGQPRGVRSGAILIAVAVAVLAIAGTSAAALVVRADRPADVEPVDAPAAFLKSARDRCDPGGRGTEVADGGQTLIIDTQGEEDHTGLSLASLTCVLRALEVPTAVTEQMYSTRALDGRQQATWNGYSASWTYHPDDGMDLIVTAEPTS